MARTKDFDELEVIDKAISIFRDKGYNGTSMADLISGLGISRSSLYDTYGNKHSLFIKALQRYHTTATQRMNTILHQCTTSKEAIKRILELTKDDLTGDLKHRSCFWVNAAIELVPHDREIENVIAQYDQQVEDILCQALKRGQNCGEIAGHLDAKTISRFFFNTVKGLSIMTGSKINSRVLDDTIEVAMSVIN